MSVVDVGATVVVVSLLEVVVGSVVEVVVVGCVDASVVATVVLGLGAAVVMDDVGASVVVEGSRGSGSGSEVVGGAVLGGGVWRSICTPRTSTSGDRTASSPPRSSATPTTAAQAATRHTSQSGRGRVLVGPWAPPLTDRPRTRRT